MASEMIEMPNALECKRRAVRAMNEASNSTISAEQFRDWLAEAQVWATLATVPEPPEIIDLDPVVGPLLAQTAAPALPALTCPHGMQARIDTTGTTLHYTWQPDCTNGCP